MTNTYLNITFGQLEVGESFIIYPLFIENPKTENTEGDDRGQGRGFYIMKKIRPTSKNGKNIVYYNGELGKLQNSVAVLPVKCWP